MMWPTYSTTFSSQQHPWLLSHHVRILVHDCSPPSPHPPQHRPSKAPGAVGEGRATAGKEHKVARDVKDPGALGFMVLVRGISVWWLGFFFLVYTAYTGTT